MKDSAIPERPATRERFYGITERPRPKQPDLEVYSARPPDRVLLGPDGKVILRRSARPIGFHHG